MASLDITIPHPQTPLIGPGTGNLTGEWQRTFTNIGKSVNDVVRTAAGTAASLVTTQGTVATHSSAIAANSSAITDLQTVRGFAHAEYATNTTLSTVIPLDDTIPQNTEGTQILSLSIAATKLNSLIRVQFQGWGGVVSSAYLIAALFVDSVANAVQVSAVIPTTTNVAANIALTYTFAPGDTAAHTLAIRVGANTGNAYMNGNGVASRFFGGAAAATLTAQEILQ